MCVFVYTYEMMCLCSRLHWIPWPSAVFTAYFAVQGLRSITGNLPKAGNNFKIWEKSQKIIEPLGISESTFVESQKYIEPR